MEVWKIERRNSVLVLVVKYRISVLHSGTFTTLRLCSILSNKLTVTSWI